jgi:hypothetical protein
MIIKTKEKYNWIRLQAPVRVSKGDRSTVLHIANALDSQERTLSRCDAALYYLRTLRVMVRMALRKVRTEPFFQALDSLVRLRYSAQDVHAERGLVWPWRGVEFMRVEWVLGQQWVSSGPGTP